MLRFSIILFVITFVVQSSARSFKNGQLIERLKRSPYYPEPYPLPRGQYWPPHPPFWHHHHGPWSFQPDQPGPHFQGQPYGNPGSSYQQYQDSQPGPAFQKPPDGQPGPNFDRYVDDLTEPFNGSCDTCKKKNAAVSNSKSVNGDAISISISRSNTNT